MASKNIEKIVEIIDSMPMLEVADLVKALEEKYGVSSAMPMMAAAPAAAAAAAPAEEEKAQYKVTLQEGGADKVKVN